MVLIVLKLYVTICFFVFACSVRDMHIAVMWIAVDKTEHDHL